MAAADTEARRLGERVNRMAAMLGKGDVLHKVRGSLFPYFLDSKNPRHRRSLIRVLRENAPQTSRHHGLPMQRSQRTTLGPEWGLRVQEGALMPRGEPALGLPQSELPKIIEKKCGEPDKS